MLCCSIHQKLNKAVATLFLYLIFQLVCFSESTDTLNNLKLPSANDLYLALELAETLSFVADFLF